ncbi:hypothetical protein D918_02061 [Trichuris suis]|nr:hypothetical protein D918_02061 [Trichuris suis]
MCKVVPGRLLGALLLARRWPSLAKSEFGITTRPREVNCFPICKRPSYPVPCFSIISFPTSLNLVKRLSKSGIGVC